VGAGQNFGSDNVAPVAAEILEAIAGANRGAVHSYGDDPHTRRLETIAREVFETDLAIFPVSTGTAANAIALAALVPPYGGVFCHELAHIVTDECGAPEFYTGGAKLLTLASPDGKLRPEQLGAPIAHAREMGVHHVTPAALSLTQATEWGTVYRREEIECLTHAAHAHQLPVHVDGARFANALVHLGCTPAEATWRAGVDVLSLGATKNGAMGAEAVIFFDPKRAADFERRRKRGGHLWSKMRYLSAQLVAYLTDGLWLRHAWQANAMARRLSEGLAALPGARLVQAVEANEVFIALPVQMIAGLRAGGFEFYDWNQGSGGGVPVVRLVASFATTVADVDRLLAVARAHGGAASGA
jgi:threonine aldolase